MSSNNFCAILLLMLVFSSYSQTILGKELNFVKNPEFISTKAISLDKNLVAAKILPYPQILNKNIQGNWTITNINGKDVNVTAIIDSRTIKFSYCDQMNYLYKLNANNIKITSNWTTQVACCRMGNGLFQEQVKQSFVNSTKFSISGNQLILRDSQGKIKIRLVRQGSSLVTTPVTKIAGKWKVLSIKGKPVNVVVTFTDSQLSYKYCNSKTNKYTLLGGDSIQFKQGISTLMACIGLNPSESQFDGAFMSSTRYSKVGSQLHLFSSAGVLNVVLQSYNQNTNLSPITGIWTTTSVGDRSLSIVVNITDKNIQFSYCNAKSYPYTVSGNTISLGIGMSTKRYCSDLNPSEAVVSKAFSSISRYSIAKNGLVFFDSQGNVVIRLIAGQHSSPISNTPSFTGSWRTTSVNGQNVAINVTISDSNIHYSYCNSKSLGYKLKGDQISLSPGISTMKYCVGLKPSQSEVDFGFSSAVKYRINTMSLELLDKNGKVVVNMVPTQTVKLSKVSTFSRAIQAI